MKPGAFRGMGAVVCGVVIWLCVGSTMAAQGQEARFRLVGPSGESASFAILQHRGYAVVPASVLEEVGWSVSATPDLARLELGREALVELRPGNPFFTWNGDVLQLTDPPYLFGQRLHIPLQLLTGFLPRRLPEDYASEDGVLALSVHSDERWTPGAASASASRTPGPTGPSGAEAAGGEESAGAEATPSEAVPEGVVVVIDPGHGGRDTGALGPGDAHEKDVTLSVAKALVKELEGEPGITIHLTRESDVLVPLWQRGERATAWKGDRPGIFLSLHVNAASRGFAVRGFETYFLSEARTDHERRVAALENSSLGLERSSDRNPAGFDPGLGFILNDLRNRGHQPWSVLLAELVQEELAPVHPGPDRGVKQAPLAVLTNALMPSVLVELGFITNDDEARLLTERGFQQQAARSLARAIRSFFDRYPPGSGGGPGSTR